MNKVDKFISSQKSLHLYENLRIAISKVLHKLNDEQFESLTNNLIIMALHENAHAQVMHFNHINDKFAIMQITIHNDSSIDDLQFIFAHELGHVFQGRNWQESDNDDLEKDADSFAKKLGYVNSLKKQA